MLTEALYLARAGFKVFPLAPKSKMPAVPKDRGGNGHQDATDAEDQIRDWWKRYPKAGVGIACLKSGLLVVDVDPRNGGDEGLKALEALHGSLTKTRSVSTGSGGYHFYYQLPEISDALQFRGKLAFPGIDLKVDGYVVAPPSIHPNGKPYRWIWEGSLAELSPVMRGLCVRPKLEQLPDDSPDFGEASLELLTSVERELKNFQGAGYHAACRLVNDYALTAKEAFPIIARWDALRPGPKRDPDRLVSKLRNAKTYAEGQRGLARLAWELEQEYGSKLPDPFELDLASLAPGDEVFLDEIKQAYKDLLSWRQVAGASDKAPKPVFTSAKNLLYENFPKVNWLVRGLVPADGMGVIGGEPKSTKTWKGLSIAIAVANSIPAFGEFPTGPAVPVALFLPEDSKRGTRNRLKSLCVGAGLDPVKALANVFVACREQLDVTNDAQLAWIIASARRVGAKLIGFDPLRDIHLEKEESSQDMARVMMQLRAVRDLCAATVYFAHHTTKRSADSARRRAGQNLRGSGALHGAVDFGLYITSIDGDKEANWATIVETEVKAAKGAGVFRLNLSVTDDDNHEAIKAVWTYSKYEGPDDDGKKSKDVPESMLQDTIAALAKLGGTATIAQLQPILNNRFDRIKAALASLKEKNFVTEGPRNTGWILAESLRRAKNSENIAKP